MAQVRFINFGDTVLASRVNSISTGIVAPGILSGGAFSLFDVSTMTVGPSTVMLTSLLLVEDAPTNIIIPNTQDPVDYTIVYEHKNQNVQGGVPAILLRLEGIFEFDELDDTVILGWVRYPGGSIPIDETMFIEAPKLQIRNPSEFPSDLLLPPYTPKIHVQSESPTPGAISQTDVYDSINFKAFLELENTNPAINSIVHFYPFAAGLQPPTRIIVEANLELGTSLTITLVAEDGTAFLATNNIMTDTSDVFEFRVMPVIAPEEADFQPNRPYYVSLASQINPGKKIQVSIVGTNTNFLPF